jgi:hypothetical protein
MAALAAPSLGVRPERPADVVRRVVSLIKERLPSGWSIGLRSDQGRPGKDADAVAELVAADGGATSLSIAARRVVEVRDLERLVGSARSGASAGSARQPLLAASYLSRSVRSWLEERRLSYADASGNLLLVVDRPAVYLRDVGAASDPWRGPGRPRGTLVGAPAARVVRALADFAGPMSIPELVRRSGASTGAAYRVVDFLQREGLVGREARGPARVVDWRRLLERWSQDYGFLRSNAVAGWLEPRGLPALIERLRSLAPGSYAVTGTLAAERLAPYAPARAAMIYAESPDEFAESLGLRPVDAGANILIAGASYDVVLERSVVADGVKFVAPSQAAVDLLTGPGRNPSEGAALLDWMENNERAWRQS